MKTTPKNILEETERVCEELKLVERNVNNPVTLVGKEAVDLYKFLGIEMPEFIENDPCIVVRIKPVFVPEGCFSIDIIWPTEKSIKKD